MVYYSDEKGFQVLLFIIFRHVHNLEFVVQENRPVTQHLTNKSVNIVQSYGQCFFCKAVQIQPVAPLSSASYTSLLCFCFVGA